AAACRLRLWADAPDVDVVDAHVGLAARCRLTDELLSRVIELPERPQALVGGLTPGARLLHKWIMESGRYEEFTRTLSALPGNPALACGLAEQVALSPGRGKTQKIDWLMRAMPALAPFTNLIGNVAQPVAYEAVARLAQAHLCCIGSLLRVADNYRRLGQVLSALTTWLGIAAELDASWGAYMAEQLRALSPRAVEQAADADL